MSQVCVRCVSSPWSLGPPHEAFPRSRARAVTWTARRLGPASLPPAGAAGSRHCHSRSWTQLPAQTRFPRSLCTAVSRPPSPTELRDILRDPVHRHSSPPGQFPGCDRRRVATGRVLFILRDVGKGLLSPGFTASPVRGEHLPARRTAGGSAGRAHGRCIVDCRATGTCGRTSALPGVFVLFKCPWKYVVGTERCPGEAATVAFKDVPGGSSTQPVAVATEEMPSVRGLSGKEASALHVTWQDAFQSACVRVCTCVRVRAHTHTYLYIMKYYTHTETHMEWNNIRP